MKRNAPVCENTNENVNHHAKGKISLKVQGDAKQQKIDERNKEKQKDVITKSMAIRKPLNRIPLRPTIVKAKKPPLEPKNKIRRIETNPIIRNISTVQTCDKKCNKEKVNESQQLDQLEISYVERKNVFPVPFADDLEEFSCPDLAFTINERLRTEEKLYMPQSTYLSAVNNRKIISKTRAALVDYLVRLHAEFHFASETLHIAVQLFDRYMSFASAEEERFARLTILVTLYVASKLEEMYIPNLEEFVIGGDHCYNRENILIMEQHICECLDYDLCSPSSLAFLRRYSKIAKMNTMHHCFAKFLLEVSFYDPVIVHWLPSFTAASALYASRFVHSRDPYWNKCLEFHTSYPNRLVVMGARRIAKLCVQYDTFPYNNVFEKYKVSRYLSISSIVRSHAIQARFKQLLNSK